MSQDQDPFDALLHALVIEFDENILTMDLITAIAHRSTDFDEQASRDVDRFRYSYYRMKSLIDGYRIAQGALAPTKTWHQGFGEPESD